MNEGSPRTLIDFFQEVISAIHLTGCDRSLPGVSLAGRLMMLAISLSHTFWQTFGQQIDRYLYEIVGTTNETLGERNGHIALSLGCSTPDSSRIRSRSREITAALSEIPAALDRDLKHLLYLPPLAGGLLR